MKNSELFKKAVKKGFKVLYIDIETSPHLLWGYGLHDQNFSTIQIKEPGKITSLAYMAENTKKCYSMEWDWLGDEGGDDSSMLEEFEPIVNEADLVIAQNGDGFDNKWLNWRMNVLSLKPIKNLLTLDTLKLSRKAFRPPSHKLDYRSRVYGLGGKIKQDMEDCIKVAEGDIVTQERRVRYNIKDVTDLRKIFIKELDYYILPKNILALLRLFIEGRKETCIHCAANHQRRFDVRKEKDKRICNNCDTEWFIEK